MKNVLLIILSVLFSLTLFGQDTIVLNNNDVLIGEIKGLSKGVITFETAYSKDDFRIEWLEVKQVISNQNYLFTFSNGERMNGKFRSDKYNPEQIIITKNDSTTNVYNIHDLVYLHTVEMSFLSKLSLDIAVGYNYTKSQHNSQLTSNAKLNYTANYWNANANYSMVRGKQDSVADVRRTEGGVGIKIFIYRDYFATASANYLQNDEQKLERRATYKVGTGKYLINSNRVYFVGILGVANTDEMYTDPTIPARNSMEGYSNLQLNMFDVGDLSLLTSISFYPNLTQLGRYRADFKFDIKYDFPLDLYIKFGTTMNYDSSPIQGATELDYFLQTTLGWEWN